MGKSKQKYLFGLLYLTLIILACTIGLASFLEASRGTDFVRANIFNAWWFESIFVLLFIGLIVSIVQFQLFSKERWNDFLFVFSVITIIVGAGLTHFKGFQGTLHLSEGETSSVIISSEKYQYVDEGGSRKPFILPFELTLTDFRFDKYLGTTSPKTYSCTVRQSDKKTSQESSHQILVNKPLVTDGYRVYLLSFDVNEKGAVFLVSYDYWGTLITYLGYILMALNLIFRVFRPKGRLRSLLKSLHTSEPRHPSIAKSSLLVLLVLLVLLSMLGVKADKHQVESFYNNIHLFEWLKWLYVALSTLLSMLLFMNFSRKKALCKWFFKLVPYVFFLSFTLLSAGLIMRWYISGHAPWSNGYEVMLLIGWSSALCGLLLIKKSLVTLALSSIFTTVSLMIAGMSWMNPVITSLTPVLSSIWLILHVSVVTVSYGFLGTGALIGLLNLVLMIVRGRFRVIGLSDVISRLSRIIEIVLIIGLVFLVPGCMLGAVWANNSWGCYWGWDPKETWALISIIVYYLILQMKRTPCLNNNFVLSAAAFWGLETIIMTFFGVNYFLTGKHSYAGSTTPSFAWEVLIVVLLVAITLTFRAYLFERKNGIVS